MHVQKYNDCHVHSWQKVVLVTFVSADFVLHRTSHKYDGHYVCDCKFVALIVAQCREDQ